MKYLLISIFSLLFLFSCTEKKKEKPDMMPVEADNGIGDGAPSLDSLLQKENNAFISEEKSDSITNSHKQDSI
jgi:hypothetical protein